MLQNCKAKEKEVCKQAREREGEEAKILASKKAHRFSLLVNTQ